MFGREIGLTFLRDGSLCALGFTVAASIDPPDLEPRRRSNAPTAVKVQAPPEPPTLTPELARVLLRIVQRADRPGAVPEARCQTDGVAS